MQQVICDHRDIEIVESAEDVCKWTTLDLHSSMVLMDVIDRRRNVSPSEYDDIIVLLDSWAIADKYDIANSKVIVASRFEDVSQKAFNVRGAWEFDTSMFDKSLDEARDVAINECMSRIDKTDTEFVNRVGETYIPKSAVVQVLVYEECE